MHYGRHAAVPPSQPRIYLADRDSAKRLSRAIALARWRSPTGLLFVAGVPLILMSRNIVDVVTNAGEGTGWASLLAVYAGLLAVTVVIAVAVTAGAMLRPNQQVQAYAFPGARIAVLCQRDSLYIELATGAQTVLYRQLKDIFGIGCAVFVRSQGVALALPRELITEPDLARIRASRRG